MIQLSKDTLEKIDKARSEGLYHEVRGHCSRAGVGRSGKGCSSIHRPLVETRAFLAPKSLAPARGVFSVTLQVTGTGSEQSRGSMTNVSGALGQLRGIGGGDGDGSWTHGSGLLL